MDFWSPIRVSWPTIYVVGK